MGQESHVQVIDALEQIHVRCRRRYVHWELKVVLQYWAISEVKRMLVEDEHQVPHGRPALLQIRPKAAERL